MMAENGLPPTPTEFCRHILSCQGFSLASAIGHSPKIVPDVREFAAQFGQFVRDDFQKRILYGADCFTCIKMVKRDEFLQLIDNFTEQDLCSFVKDCRKQGSGNDCLQEIFGSCSKKQLDHVWQQVYTAVSVTLLGVGSSESGGENQQSDSCTESTLDLVQCIVAMVTAMTNQNEVYIPDFLFQTALLLQDMLPNLPAREDKTKNSIARLFEDWWKKNLQQRDDMIVTTLVYLVQRSLDLEPKPLAADVKRVWSLHEVLALIDLQNESSRDFKELLRRCFISSQYMQHSEGVRFLSYILTLDECFMKDLHRTIKNHLPTLPRSWDKHFGEMYFRAWQQTSGTKQQRLEQSCIQDLMYHAVHAQKTLRPMLEKILGYVHKQKKQKGVDEMLLRLYEPFLWRCLRVANPDVRYNAAVLFFDVFPLQDPNLRVKERDESLQKQFDLIRELLYDPFPKVRSLSIKGLSKVMTEFWEMIPADTVKNLVLTLIQDLLADASSSDVRQGVVKGLNKLLDNPLTHLFLKPILPQITNAFHDVSEKVRVSMLDLLIKVKTLRAIKYWNIVLVEHLLARLVVDSDPVNRRIVKLISPSFLPLEASSDVQLERCIALIKANPAAARQMFRYASQRMSIDDTVKYMSLLCKAILVAIKRGNENGAESEDDDQSDEGNSESDEELKVTNTPVMLGMCEIILILWWMNESALKNLSNAQHKKDIEKKFSYALPEMLNSLSDPQIVSVLIQIAGHLPANYIPFISRAWVPRLRNMTTENVEADYNAIITSVCEMGQAADIFELVVDWITPSFVVKSPSAPSSVKARKKKKKVGFVEQREPQPQLGLDFLSFMLRHHPTRDIVLRDHCQDCVNMRDLLRGCKGCIQEYVNGQTDTDGGKREKFLKDTFLLYCKISVLLNSVDNKKYSCLEEMVPVLSWADKHVVPILSVKEETDQVGTKRSAPSEGQEMAVYVIQTLLSTYSNMLEVGIGDLTTCTQLVDFCTVWLAADMKLCLLSDVMLCLYQVTEFVRFNSPSETDNNWSSSTIPNALSRILVNIASHVRQNAETSAKLLGGVKGHMLELLKSVFTAQSPNDSVLPDVMATIFATVLAELSFFSSHFDLEDDCSPAMLPPVSSWLLDIVHNRPNILRYFVQEVSNFVDSEDIVGLHNVHGTVHLLGSLTKCKHKVEGLRDLWNVINKKTKNQLDQQTEEDAETNKELTSAIETKLKEIQIS